MALITKDDVKSKFKHWDKYYLDETGTPDDTLIDSDIEVAEIELSKYVVITGVSNDEVLKRIKTDLIKIVKYLAFINEHGDREFDNKPRIVKDYEDVIAYWNDVQKGQQNINAVDTTARTGSGAIRVTAKTRKFKNWFTGE